MNLERELWRSMQELKNGENKSLWVLHQDAHNQFNQDHRLCLVVKPLNLKHQPPVGIRNTMPRAWSLVGKVKGQVNDDGSVNFYFRREHHLHMVLEGASYPFRGWMLAIDRWSYRDYPTFLKKIPFWIHINKLPNKYRRTNVESIGSRLGQVYAEDIQIVEPTPTKPAQVFVRVDFDVDDQILLVRNVQIMSGEPPVELEFRYDVLQKFCTTCGSLRHDDEDCQTRLTQVQQDTQLVHICAAIEGDSSKIHKDAIANMLSSSVVKRNHEASSSSAIPQSALALSLPMQPLLIKEPIVAEEQVQQMAAEPGMEAQRPVRRFKRKNPDSNTQPVNQVTKQKLDQDEEQVKEEGSQAVERAKGLVEFPLPISK